MSIKDLIKLVNGTLTNLPSDNDKTISGFRLDSRDIKDNEVFVCVGKGYMYIEDAINNGAMAVVTDKNIHLNTNVAIIKVSDMEIAILNIVKGIRNNYHYIPLVAITGSIGKTTTKELISQILGSKYKVLKNLDNQNNYIGIANTMFKLNTNYDVVVLEVGMNHASEIDRISSAIMPDISVITNIGTSHIGNLGSVEGILKAKLEITNGMKDGILIVPYLDKRLKKISYERIDRCWDIKIRKIKLSDKLRFILKCNHIKNKIKFNIPNKGYVSNIVLAYKVATYFDIKNDDIINIINNYQSVHSRMKIIDKDKYRIIDDTYNSSYESLKEALNYLNTCPKRMVVLGDIKELGNYSIKIHKQINKLLCKIKTNNILLVGEDTLYIKGIHFSTNKDIIEYLKKQDLSGYDILIKGSRVMHLEEIVNEL